MKFNNYFRVFLVIWFFAGSQLHAQQSNEDHFLSWAKKNYVPINLESTNSQTDYLEAIAESIGDSKVVAISERIHNSEEMLALQLELVNYLVTTKGFDIVMSETGLPESKYMNDYVHGGQPIPNLYEKGIARLYGEWETGRSLIEWLRTYNKNAEQPVSYIGADIGGFYRNWEMPFTVIYDYLDKVDPTFLSEFQAQFNPLLTMLHQNARRNYGLQFTNQQRAQLLIFLEELVNHFGENERAYIKKINKEEFEWAHQSAKSMFYAANYYQNSLDNKNNYISRYVGANGREIAMSENVLWALEQNPNSKIILINHIVHTKTDVQFQNNHYRLFAPTGSFLKNKLGDQFYALGLLYGKGTLWKNWMRPENRLEGKTPGYANGSVESIMSKIADTSYFIPWNKASGQAKTWLNDTHIIRETNFGLKLRPLEWDSCIFLNEISPAKPATKP